MFKKTSTKQLAPSFDDNIDFQNFSLGVGSVQEKKQRLTQIVS
jgi:hypothetical protein